VTQFVDECRREWRRLRVPDAVANEMAAELEADLHDAEDDGRSAEEVLGNGVFDAPSFAAAWASERGVIPPPSDPSPRRYRTLGAAVTGALAIGVLLVGIAILTGRPVKEVSVASPLRFRPPIAAHRLILPGAKSTAPRFFVTPAPVGIVQSGLDIRPAGWILLVLGLTGIAASILLWRGFPLRSRSPSA
jgi:hypothetical protein